MEAWRIRGNLLAVFDVLRSRLIPERIWNFSEHHPSAGSFLALRVMGHYGSWGAMSLRCAG